MKLTAWGSLRVVRAIGWLGVLGLVAIYSVTVSGCRRENPSTFDSNLPPETFLVDAPPESSGTYYQVELRWSGEDPDGLVVRYEYAVTDTTKVPGEDTPNFSGYFSTFATDSVFTLSANNPFTLLHRFYVRAVDNEGKVDPSPAWVAFVAENFNPPQVHFNRAIGTWTDKAGNERKRVLTSTDPFQPTDTLGVGGSVDFAWTGSDADVGGFVTAFFYRWRSDFDTQGGTLADTTASRVYPSTFSGRDAVFVTAVDDAGARTPSNTPSSIRSFLVNFDPLAWFVDPEDPESKIPRRAFKDNDTQRVFPSGAILSDDLGSRNITLYYTGIDDDRDIPAGAEEHNLKGFQLQKVLGRAVTGWKDIPDWEAFPVVNVLNDNNTQQLPSGDYKFVIRSVDALGGAPSSGKTDTVEVRVNYPPYLVSVNYVDDQGGKHLLWDYANPDVIQSITVPAYEEGDSLTVEILASDVHRVDNPIPEDPNTVWEDETGNIRSYLARGNLSFSNEDPAPTDGSPYIARFALAEDPSIERRIREGLNDLFVRVKDFGQNGGRETEMIIKFCVSFEGSENVCANSN